MTVDVVISRTMFHYNGEYIGIVSSCTGINSSFQQEKEVRFGLVKMRSDIGSMSGLIHDLCQLWRRPDSICLLYRICLSGLTKLCVNIEVASNTNTS